MKLSKKAIDKVYNHFKNMPDEEFKAMIEELMPKETCKPETCGGECQGMGGCELAIGFRKDLHITLQSIMGNESLNKIELLLAHKEQEGK